MAIASGATEQAEHEKLQLLSQLEDAKKQVCSKQEEVTAAKEKIAYFKAQLEKSGVKVREMVQAFMPAEEQALQAVANMRDDDDEESNDDDDDDDDDDKDDDDDDDDGEDAPSVSEPSNQRKRKVHHLVIDVEEYGSSRNRRA
jgi:chromosome segregation ATPase